MTLAQKTCKLNAAKSKEHTYMYIYIYINIYSHLKGEIHNVEENLENWEHIAKWQGNTQRKHMNPSTPPPQKNWKTSKIKFIPSKTKDGPDISLRVPTVYLYVYIYIYIFNWLSFGFKKNHSYLRNMSILTQIL